mmetsp:Transcript_13753/g.27349  ORF Transcript_13753/g.27349 Transcript_13753/m.27349 type:complete len:181 (+) Transcript_13753:221-763(+)
MGNPLGSSSVSGSFLSSSPTAAASVCGEGGGSEGAGLWYTVEVAERGVMSLHLKSWPNRQWGFNFLRGDGRACAGSPSATDCTCVHTKGEALEYEAFPVVPEVYFVAVLSSLHMYIPQKNEHTLSTTFLREGVVSPSFELRLNATVSGEFNDTCPQTFSFLPRKTCRVAFTLCSSRPVSL